MAPCPDQPFDHQWLAFQSLARNAGEAHWKCVTEKRERDRSHGAYISYTTNTLVVAVSAKFIEVDIVTLTVR
jgi:hypothetical protein